MEGTKSAGASFWTTAWAKHTSGKQFYLWQNILLAVSIFLIFSALMVSVSFSCLSLSVSQMHPTQPAQNLLSTYDKALGYDSIGVVYIIFGLATPAASSLVQVSAWSGWV
jgi:hypothetical protein